MSQRGKQQTGNLRGYRIARLAEKGDSTERTRSVTRRLLVHGHVQGVGFRYWTREEAVLLSLRGWVRNRRDHTVEILCTGPADAVARLRSIRAVMFMAGVLPVSRRGPQACASTVR